MHIRDVCYLYVASNVVKIMFIALFQLHASYTMTVFSVCVNDTVSAFSARDELLVQYDARSTVYFNM